ncbi:MAG TPA: ABC transporter permease [Methylomirabilota bacterium]|jgi:spermidine/putrescine transport system permease protein|nr:ABC transporter permease [Methylomirabilota bacterium]
MRQAILTRLYRWPWVKILLFLLPGLALLLVYLVIPLGMLVTMSFYRSTLFGIVPDFSWNNYLHFTRNPMFPNLLVRSIRMALTVTAISLLVSYPFAYFLARTTRRYKTALLILVMVPFWTSYLIRTMSWLPILGIKGIVNYSLMSLQIVSSPVEAFLFNEFSVILTLTHIYLPYMVIPIYLSLDRLDGRLLEAAGDLGANPARAFWHVTLPLSLPGVVGGIVMVFIAGFGAYVTPKLLGGSSGIMFGNVLADQYSGTFNWPFGAVLALIMVAVVFILLLVASRFTRLDAVFGAGR